MTIESDWEILTKRQNEVIEKWRKSSDLTKKNNYSNLHNELDSIRSDFSYKQEKYYESKDK